MDVAGFIKAHYIKRKGRSAVEDKYQSTPIICRNMIRNYFKIAVRNLKINKAYTLINISGLTLGMTCELLIFMLVKYHLSFDNFHEHSERIYRIVTEQHRDDVSYQRSVPAPLGKAFKNDYTFAEKSSQKIYINQITDY